MVEKTFVLCIYHFCTVSEILLLRASPVLPSGVTHLSLGGLPHMLHHATCHMPHMNHQDPLQIQCNYLFPHIAHLAGPDEALAGMLHLNVCHLSSPPNNTGPRCICLPCRAIGNVGHIVDIHTQKSFSFLWKFTGKHIIAEEQQILGNVFYALNIANKYCHSQNDSTYHFIGTHVNSFRVISNNLDSFDFRSRLSLDWTFVLYPPLPESIQLCFWTISKCIHI